MPKQRRRAKRARAKAKESASLELKSSTLSFISGIVQIGAAVVVFFALQGTAGQAGSVIQTAFTGLFGAYAMIAPVFLGVSGLMHWFAPTKRMQTTRSFGLILGLFSFLGLMSLRLPFGDLWTRHAEAGGAIGFLMALPFVAFFSAAVGYTVLSITLIVGIIIAFEPNLDVVFEGIRGIFAPPDREEEAQERKISKRAQKEEEEDEEEWEEEEKEDDDLIERDEIAPELNIVRPLFVQNKMKPDAAQKKMAIKKNDDIEMKDTRFEEWTFPTFDLLEEQQSTLHVDDEELKRQAKLIEEKLREFGIDVTMRDARPGPTVTQFTLQPSEGVKLSKIGSLKDDLTLALAAQTLRIEAPIPGKALVGIEMPNKIRTTVHLKEILESPSFVQSQSSLTLPLGRDVSGESIVASLETMPHLLIAGATGSGKSVCMNTFLVAMLFQNAPHELKLILIDPKRVELMPYDGIPHLLTPVITEAEKALQALRWAVAEMGRRLHRFSEIGARNLDEYNEKQQNEDQMLPRIVIVIDELADLMMRQFRKDTETMIARIAQMARAVGMHLIIATQRPSVDVITGLIKANIPTRMAFRVVSAVDSRTILDSIGAEDLLGQGDMLFMNAATPKPVRVQGIYTSTKEVERVINAVKIAGGGKLTEQIGLGEEDENGDRLGTPMANQQHIDLDADDNGGDDLFFEALRVVQQTGKASASLLQRQLKVGYARAARLLDIMEERGLIGPADGAKPRKVFVAQEAEPSQEP
jgi:S-DNA-T family DNA segregation ATPase FtsK/SpoIIIE